MQDHPSLEFEQSEQVKALLLDIVSHITAGALGGNLDLDGVLATLAQCHSMISLEHDRANKASYELRWTTLELSKARRKAWY